MPSLSIALWMLRRVTSTPIGWLWLTASLLGVPLLRALTPEGVVGHADGSNELVVQVAFLSSLSGAMLALAGLARNDWMLGLSSTGKQLRAQAAGLGTAGLLGAALVTLGNGLPVGHGSSPDASALLAMGLASAHLAALGTALLQRPGAPEWLPLGLPLLGWILPATLPQRTLPWLQHVLQAHRDPISLRDWSPAGFLAAVGPILVWAGLSWLLSQRRSLPLRPSPR